MAVKVAENYPLNDLNTFGVPVTSRFFARIEQKDELKDILLTDVARNNPVLILGGGSNILFTENYPGLTLLIQLKGIAIIEESGDKVLVVAGAGEVWQNLVDFSLRNQLGGLENLSLIPGSVGAAPIQNIGAYGVELKEVMESLTAVELATGNERTFSNSECNFGYRDSVFKNELKDKYLITAVQFRLAKKPQLNTSYGAIDTLLAEKGITQPTVRDVSEAVIEIRQSKLPDPEKLGNAGSFFKNPVVDKIDFEGLKLLFNDIPGYPNGDKVKIPAAWLIEQCEWKGRRFGSIGVHDQQPLVLVNYGGGTGTEIKNLAENIKKSIADKFGIELEIEPRII
jgi:UDP-N-acetylmuramate dehydrogenase